ncbi:MAG TPA: NUDIX domain-containing protein [Propionibacteriaceae bacterium]
MAGGFRLPGPRGGAYGPFGAPLTAYAITACVLLHRAPDEWLLSVRAPGVRFAPDTIGLIGGHLEPSDIDLEATARREFAEETGVDLSDVALRYLESALLDGEEPQLTVTFVAAAPDDVRPRLGAPEELAEVGWWTRTAAAADPRCPPWLLPLLDRAQAAHHAG